jgi:hypothetical protein
LLQTHHDRASTVRDHMATNFLADKSSAPAKLAKTQKLKETHSERLVRAARLAGEVTGPDLGEMSREERRKLLFG